MPRPAAEGKNEQRLPSSVVIRRIFSFYRSRLAPFSAVLVLHMIVMAADLAGPKILGRLLDTLRGDFGPAGMRAVWPLFWLFGASVAVKNLFRFFRGWLNVRVGMDIVTELRERLHRKFLELSFKFHNDATSGELIALTTRDVDKVAMVYFEILISGAEAVLMSLGVILITGAMSHLLGAIVLGMFVLTVAGIYAYARRLPAFWRKAADSYDLVTGVLQESVAGVRVVKAFAREDKEMGKFAGRIVDYKDREIDAGHFLFSRMPLANGIFHAAVPLVLVAGGRMCAAGTLSIGDLSAIVLYLYFFTHRLRMYGRIVEIMQESVASADRIFAVLDDASLITGPARPSRLPESGGSVVFEGVSFGYGAEPVIRDLSLEIRAGETVGLLGRTGSGKSTLGALIPRFYDPREGRVLVDGVDARELDPVELRRAATVVFQDTFLFADKIGENIRLGRRDAPQEEVVAAARAAQIHDFIAGLKDGYDTVVGERGVSLSGGQKQRTAIARALLMRPRILILDDATASVDSKTEAALHRAVMERREGTTIIISQRISSVAAADRIVVLEGGRVAAEGTHDSLSREPGLYREMFEAQMAAA